MGRRQHAKGHHFFVSTQLPKISGIIAESKTGLGCLKNKETQQAAGMNQAKTGLVETDSKLSLLKPVKSWPQLDNSKAKTGF